MAVSKETKEQIQQMLIEGKLSMKQIADKAGVCCQTVVKVRNKMNADGWNNEQQTVKRMGGLHTPYNQKQYHISHY